VVCQLYVLPRRWPSDSLLGSRREQCGFASRWDDLANLLQLDEAECDHLMDLARASVKAPARRRPAKSVGVTASVQQVVDAFTEALACVGNARYDLLAANRLARALYAPLLADVRRPANNARFVYLEPASQDFFQDWERR
jgi:hypothetical protein